MKITTPDMLAAMLKDQRKQQGLTQQQTADRVGLQQKTISAFEQSPERCKIETLFKLLASLELELQVNPRGQLNSQSQGWDQEW